MTHEPCQRCDGEGFVVEFIPAGRVEIDCDCAAGNERRAAREVDLDLLRKLADGKGGERTGALKRAGYLTWTVTPAGTAALARKNASR